MQNKLDIAVVILAAGSGSRFGGAKQFCSYKGMPLVEYTAHQFLPLNLPIYIAAPQPVANFTTIPGGATRAQSLLNVLQAISHEWILVHDAARPELVLDDVRALMDLAQSGKGAYLARPVSSTLRTTANQTVDRNAYLTAITPQCFKRLDLIKAYEQALAKNIVPTDEAHAMELAGLPYTYHIAKTIDKKITYREDLCA